MAKTEALLAVQWDNTLKMGEHEEFFYRFSKKGKVMGLFLLLVFTPLLNSRNCYLGGFLAAYCSNVTMPNLHGSCSLDKGQVSISVKNRMRARTFIKQACSLAICIDIQRRGWGLVLVLLTYESGVTNTWFHRNGRLHGRLWPDAF